MNRFAKQFATRFEYVRHIEQSERLEKAIALLKQQTIKTTVALALAKANVVRECQILHENARSPDAKRLLKECEREALLQISSGTRSDSENVIRLDDYRK